MEDAFEAFEAGDYQLALNGFMRAQELNPRASLEFNIGMCLERLGRLREAMNRYERALASDELGVEGAARARAQLEGLTARVARVVADEPEGGYLRVGESGECRIPCSLALDPGTHLVVLQDGRRSTSKSVTLSPGATERVQFSTSRMAIDDVEPRETREPSLTDDEVPGAGYSPGVLTIIGSGLTVLGGAGIVGFGLRTDELHQRYLESPTADLADEGETMMLLANASIGAAILGGVLVLVDILAQL
ncbi:MAG: tetratricopeptide repeat protein [Myxococcota bacterium]